MKKTYLVEEIIRKTYELEGTELEIQDEIERIMSDSANIEKDPDYYSYTAKEEVTDFEKMDFMINEKMISNFMSYFCENFYRPGYDIIHNIIRYTAAQGLNKEDSVDMLCDLLDGQGMSREEILELLEE